MAAPCSSGQKTGALRAAGCRQSFHCANYVVVSVSDTGTGMNRKTLQRVFEPFFTTKEVGRGSGLGLSIVHGFAAQSGGSVHITSAPGKGTRVDLWLPAAEAEPIKSVGIESDRSIMELGEMRILVCDDDPDVLGFVGTVLREDGCVVFEADTPLAALEIIETELPFDLLLVDYAMPEMNGVAVIDRARALQQGLKVLLMSGHADVSRCGGRIENPAARETLQGHRVAKANSGHLVHPASRDHLQPFHFPATRCLAITFGLQHNPRMSRTVFFVNAYRINVSNKTDSSLCIHRN